MTEPATRIRSELPSGDPALMNRVAWSRRWSDRQASTDYALTARRTASAGTGRRSRLQQGFALRTLGWHARWRGALDEAMGHCLAAETFLPEKDHPEARAAIYAILGSIHFARNRFDLARCSVERGFWLVRDMPEPEIAEAKTELLLTRATIQRHTGEAARAGITLSRAQELAGPEAMPGVEYCTASWLLADGDVAGAQERAETALAQALEQGNKVIRPYLHCLLGACHTRAGRPGEALEHFASGLALAQEDADDRVTCFIHRHRAELEVGRGDLDEAQSHLETAARLAKARNHAFERKRIALALADVFERLGKYKKAVDQHKLAWRLQNETRMS